MQHNHLLIRFSISWLASIALCSPALAQPKDSANSVAARSQANERHNGSQISKALLGAADQGDASALDLLLRRGGNANATDEDGWTPLMFAAAGGHLAATRTLLKAGSNVNHAAQDGSTPLHVAAANGSVSVVRTLLSAGAESWHKDAKGRGASALAQMGGHMAVHEVILSEAQPRPITAAPKEPFGPILGVLQLGMPEGQLREILGGRFARAEVLDASTYLIRRHPIWGSSGDLRLGFDSQRRLVAVTHALVLSDRYGATAALAGIESWAGLPRPINTRLTIDHALRNEDTFSLGVAYAKGATEFTVEIRLKANVGQ